MSRWTDLINRFDTIFTLRLAGMPGDFLDELRAALTTLIEEQESSNEIMEACRRTRIAEDDTVPEHIFKLYKEIQVAKRALCAEFIPETQQTAKTFPLAQIVEHACEHHGWHHETEREEVAKLARARQKKLDDTRHALNSLVSWLERHEDAGGEVPPKELLNHAKKVLR